MKLRPIDYLMGVAVAATWGMGIVVAKAAIGEQFPPILLMALRFAVTALVMVWFVKPPLGSISKIFGIAVISAAIQYSLTFTGLKDLDASVVALLVQLEVPFLVLLGAVFLKEQPGLRKWVGIGIAFVGIGLIASEFGAGFRLDGLPQIGSNWLPILLVIGGAFTWSVGQVLVRMLRGIDGLTMMTWIAVCATPQLFVMSAIFESDHVEKIQSAGFIVWAAVIYLGLAMNAFGYGLWYTLVHQHPVSQVAPFLLLLPVFSVIGGMLFLGEMLSLQTVIGGVIVLTGVAAIVFEREDEEGSDEKRPEAVPLASGGPPLIRRSYVWPDGSRYDGEWLNGRAHGYGVMVWSIRTPWPGDRYKGEWSNGRLNGEGVYVRADGTHLQGHWVRGEKVN